MLHGRPYFSSSSFEPKIIILVSSERQYIQSQNATGWAKVENIVYVRLDKNGKLFKFGVFVGHEDFQKLWRTKTVGVSCSLR